MRQLRTGWTALGSCRSPQGDAGTLWARGACEHHCLWPLHLLRACRSSGLPARSQLRLATFPGTCWLWTKGPLRNNKVSPQAPGRQACTPGTLSAFRAPTSFPKLPGSRKPTQQSLPHKTTFSTTNGRERLGSCAKSPGTAEEPTVHVPFHLHGVGRGSLQGQGHCSTFPTLRAYFCREQRQQTGSTGHYLHTPDLLTWCPPAQWTSAPDVMS